MPSITESLVKKAIRKVLAYERAKPPCEGALESVRQEAIKAAAEAIGEKSPVAEGEGVNQ